MLGVETLLVRQAGGAAGRGEGCSGFVALYAGRIHSGKALGARLMKLTDEGSIGG